MKNYIFIVGICLMTFSLKAQNKIKIDKDQIFKTEQLEEFSNLNATPIDSLTDAEKNAKRIVFKKNKPKYSIQKNGTTYILISFYQTTRKDCIRCNSSSNTTCSARYRIESREYTKWKNGNAVKVWTSTVSIFSGCGWW